MHFSKSLSNGLDNLSINGLPVISYRSSLVQPNTIPDFLRRLTTVDKHLTDEEKEANDIIESIILNDMQLFLNYYHYLNTETSVLRNIGLFFYQPYSFVRTKLNDFKLMKEVNKVFDMDKKEDALVYIRSINMKLERFLELKGQGYYEKVSERHINSLDLLIYAAYKAQKLINVNLVLLFSIMMAI
jgi:hypothetical protein